MSWAIHLDWAGQTQLVGHLSAHARGPAVAFEYAPGWLQRADAFSIDPTGLPLQPSALLILALGRIKS